MLSKKEHINYWIDFANDDWESVQILFKSGKFTQGLFFTHLVLEKISKALWLKDNEANYPPKIHDILKILNKTKVVLEDEDLIYLNALNVYQLEGRYPDYINQIHKMTNLENTEKIILDADRIRLCLIRKLQ